MNGVSVYQGRQRGEGPHGTIQNWMVVKAGKEAKLAKEFRQLKYSDSDTAF